MKTSKPVYLGVFFILLLQGCMPDSFTKFKEDPAKASSGATTTPTQGPSEDLDLSDVTFPTEFFYSSTPQTFIFEVDQNLSQHAVASENNWRPHIDGSFGSWFSQDPVDRDQEDKPLFVGSGGLDVKFRVQNAAKDCNPPSSGGTCQNCGTGLTFFDEDLPDKVRINEEGQLEGTPDEITSDTTAGNEGLPYELNLVMEYYGPPNLNRVTMCTTIKVGAYKAPNPSGFYYQQSQVIKLGLQDFVGQGSIDAFAVGDSVATVDPDGLGPLLPGQGTVIFVNKAVSQITVQKTAGEFQIGYRIDDSSAYVGPEATINNVINVYQTSDLINLLPTTPPPTNDTLTEENGIRYLVNFSPLPSTMTFDELTGTLNGTLNAPIQESILTFVAVNPLWRSDTHDFEDVLSGTATFEDVDVAQEYIPKARGSQTTTAPLTSFSSNIVITDPAGDAGYADQALLLVSDATPFSPGDFISTSSTCAMAALGRVVATIDKDPPAYDYILVQQIHGCRFDVGNSIDNTWPFKSPKATVYESIANSIVIETSADVTAWGTTHISASNGAKGVINLIQNGSGGAVGLADGVEQGLGSDFYIFVRVTSPVDSDNDLDKYFSTQTIGSSHSNEISDCKVYSLAAPCVNRTIINNIFAGNIEITATDPSPFTNWLPIKTGSPVSADPILPQQGIGEIQLKINDTTPRINVTVNSGVFRVGADFSASNPYGATPAIQGSVAYIPTFYLYKDKYYDIRSAVDQGASGAIFELDPPILPDGMTLEADGSIKGTPTQSMSSRIYKLKTSNSAGITVYKFKMEVIDSVELKISGFETTAANSSAILHKAGRGNQLKSCRISKAQMDAGVENDILCYLDVGEEELYRGSLSLDFSVGDNLCQFVSHRPFSYYRYRPDPAGPSTYSTYTHTGYTTCNSPPQRPDGEVRPVAVNTTDAAGQTPLAVAAADICLKENGGFDYKNLADFTNNLLVDYAGPNCDEGQVLDSDVAWTPAPLICKPDPVSTDASITTAGECIENYGDCGGGGCPDNGLCDADPTGGGIDCSGCTTKTTCEGDGATWIFTGDHNDTTYGPDADAPVTNAFNQGHFTGSGQDLAMGDCTSAAPVPDPGNAIACGGSAGNCMVHPLNSIDGQIVSALSGDALKEKYFMVTSIPFGKSEVSYNYIVAENSDPEDLNDPDIENNFIMSNYYNGCGHTDYSYNIANIEAASDGGGANLMDAGLGTSPFYEYRCKNASGDSIGSIKLVIREWDLDFSGGMDELDKAVPGSLMDVPGVNNNYGGFKDYTANACVGFDFNPGATNFFETTPINLLEEAGGGTTTAFPSISN